MHPPRVLYQIHGAVGPVEPALRVDGLVRPGVHPHPQPDQIQGLLAVLRIGDLIVPLQGKAQDLPFPVAGVVLFVTSQHPS